jgi:uncharacterized protein (TIGR04255 family)
MVWKEYTTYEDYRQEILLRVKDFCKVNPITEFSRVGLRYINNIKFASDKAHTNLERYVNLPIETYGHERNAVLLCREETRLRIEGDLLSIRTSFFERDESNPSESVCVLDYDCYNDTKVSLGDLAETLDRFHHHIQLQFLSQVTDEYKSIMRQQGSGE